MFWSRRRPVPPAELTSVLRSDEDILASAQDSADGWWAVTRYGIWRLPAGSAPELVAWQLISKVTWQSPVLRLVRADVVGELADAELIVDRPAEQVELITPGKLTDVIHQRVRTGIISSTHHEFAGGGGWLVVRRVPGRDGPVAQVRLDPGTRQDDARQWLPELVTRAMEEFDPDR